MCQAFDFPGLEFSYFLHFLVPLYWFVFSTSVRNLRNFLIIFRTLSKFRPLITSIFSIFERHDRCWQISKGKKKKVRVWSMKRRRLYTYISPNQRRPAVEQWCARSRRILFLYNGGAPALIKSFEWNYTRYADISTRWCIPTTTTCINTSALARFRVCVSCFEIKGSPRTKKLLHSPVCTLSLSPFLSVCVREKITENRWTERDVKSLVKLVRISFQIRMESRKE